MITKRVRSRKTRSPDGRALVEMLVEEVAWIGVNPMALPLNPPVSAASSSVETAHGAMTADILTLPEVSLLLPLSSLNQLLFQLTDCYFRSLDWTFRKWHSSWPSWETKSTFE